MNMYIKDSACPAELPRWLSWYSVCLVCRMSRVRIPPEAAPLFLLRKRELCSGVVALLCLVSMTDRSCTVCTCKCTCTCTNQDIPLCNSLCRGRDGSAKTTETTCRMAVCRHCRWAKNRVQNNLTSSSKFCYYITWNKKMKLNLKIYWPLHVH